MKIRTIAVNGVLAALYIAVSMLIAPFGFSSIQFRVSEMFNHLVVFNKKYVYGIVLGVFLTNLFSPFGVYDLIFGVGQSIIALLITIFSTRFIKGTWTRMFFNSIVFTFTMFLIAWEITLLNPALPFLLTWLTTAIGEFGVMIIGAPVMYYLNKRIKFKELI